MTIIEFLAPYCNRFLYFLLSIHIFHPLRNFAEVFLVIRTATSIISPNAAFRLLPWKQAKVNDISRFVVLRIRKNYSLFRPSVLTQKSSGTALRDITPTKVALSEVRLAYLFTSEAMESVIQVKLWDEAFCVLLHSPALGKGMNPFSLSYLFHLLADSKGVSSWCHG